MLFEICQTFMAAAVLYSHWSLRRVMKSQTRAVYEENASNSIINQESSTESIKAVIAETNPRKRFKYTHSECAKAPSHRRNYVKRHEQSHTIIPQTSSSYNNDEDEVANSVADSEYYPVNKSSNEDSSDDVACISTKKRTTPVLEDQRFYCPYKGCGISRTHRPQLYNHLRVAHDAYFTTVKGANHVFRTPSGEDITFDESSQDMLESDEVIDVQRAPSRRRKSEVHGEKAYCPYRGCNLLCERRNILKHIRMSHNPSLTKRQIGINYKVVLKTDLGYIVHLDDEKCRDTLEPGQSVDTEVVRVDFVGNRVPVVIPNLHDSN